ncbi:MAG TPA: hypothetical protein VGH33_20460, partial [Isosphaeraceae bacterium]
MRHLFAASLWLAAIVPPSALAAEGSNSPVGQAHLASGLEAHYAYHYDRNALRDSQRAGDALIALTRSGNLLRFDANTLTFTREWFGAVPATCLGRGENDTVLVGFDDGRVCRVDLATLALAEVAKLPDRVRWVGASTSGDGRTGLVALVDQHGSNVYVRWSVVHDLVTGKTYEVKRRSFPDDQGKTREYAAHATAFFIDSKRRAWLGADQGELGGWCYRIDLDAGRVSEIAGIKERPDEPGDGWDGVYGFAELPDGRVWAHGGTMHMGTTEGFLRRVDGPKVEELYKYGNFEARKGHEDDAKIPEPKQPYLPITHILPDGDGRLLILAYSNIYRVDTGLKEWSRDEPLRIRYRAGRPDAVGVYPSIVAVHRLDGRLICATAVDGYVSMADGKAAVHALSGQFGLDRAWRVAGSSEGTLFSPWDDREPTWRLKAGGWEVADLAPPCEPEPGGPLIEGEKPSWSETHLLIEQSGAIDVVSSTGGTPGTRTTARRVDGKLEILGRETSHLNVRACFFTPDGGLWNADYGDLQRFVDGRWRSVAPLPGAGPLGVQGYRTGDTNFPVGWGLQAVGDSGPPWVLLDRTDKQLLRLRYGPDFKEPKLDAVKVVENSAPLKILDAIPWSKAELLLATDKGLRRLDVASAKIHPPPLPAPDRPATSLARDGL